MDAQFTRDRGPGSDPFNRPKAMFLATGISGAILEIEVDLDLFDPNPAGLTVGPSLQDCLAGKAVFQPVDDFSRQIVLGINFLCPRCQSPLYVPSLDNPKPRTEKREIIVHWDKPIRAQDGVLRPSFTVSGLPLKCDYLNSEITGISGPGIVRCGWSGVIEGGKAYEHSVIRASNLLR